MTAQGERIEGLGAQSIKKKTKNENFDIVRCSLMKKIIWWSLFLLLPEHPSLSSGSNPRLWGWGWDFFGQWLHPAPSAGAPDPLGFPNWCQTAPGRGMKWHQGSCSVTRSRAGLNCQNTNDLITKQQNLLLESLVLAQVCVWGGREDLGGFRGDPKPLQSLWREGWTPQGWNPRCLSRRTNRATKTQNFWGV